MLAAFILSIRQLGDPAFLRVFAKSLGLTMVVMAMLGIGLWFAVRPLADMVAGAGWSTALAGVIAVTATLLAGWLAFRAVAIAVVGLFADDIVAAVEARHYPQALASARPVPVARSLAMGAGAAARTVLVNLAFAPLYIVLLATGVGTAIGFFMVNALLLGRDLGDMVAVRHLPAADLRPFRQATRWPRAALGAVGTGLFLIPFVNLAAPVIGAAMATHLFHRRLSR